MLTYANYNISALCPRECYPIKFNLEESFNLYLNLFPFNFRTTITIIIINAIIQVSIYYLHSALCSGAHSFVLYFYGYTHYGRFIFSGIRPRILVLSWVSARRAQVRLYYYSLIISSWQLCINLRLLYSYKAVRFVWDLFNLFWYQHC